MWTCAHHFLTACYNEPEDGLCQCGDGVTLWLCLAGSDPVTSSSSSSQPAHPAYATTRHREEGPSWAGGWSWKLISGLLSLRQALSHAQPHHLNMTKYWHCKGSTACVCVCCLSESLKMALTTPSVKRFITLFL